MGMKIPASMKVDEQQAIYWNGPVSRKELQQVINEQEKVISELQSIVFGELNETNEIVKPGLFSIVQRLDIAMAFLMERLACTPQDVNDYLTKKQLEFAKTQASQAPATKAAVPDGPKLVTL